MPWGPKASGIGWGTGSAGKPIRSRTPHNPLCTKSGTGRACQGCWARSSLKISTLPSSSTRAPHCTSELYERGVESETIGGAQRASTKRSEAPCTRGEANNPPTGRGYHAYAWAEPTRGRSPEDEPASPKGRAGEPTRRRSEAGRPSGAGGLISKKKFLC